LGNFKNNGDRRHEHLLNRVSKALDVVLGYSEASPKERLVHHENRITARFTFPEYRSDVTIFFSARD
jgi:hypothetical protein